MSDVEHESRRAYLLITLAVVVVDQLTKVAAHQWLRPAGSVPIDPGFFDLTYSRNRGGLFGYFGELPEPLRLALLTALPVLAIVLLGRFLLRGHDLTRAARIGLAAVLGGAVGNHWPTFNVADSAIVIGAGLLLVDVLVPRASARAAAPTPDSRSIAPE